MSFFQIKKKLGKAYNENYTNATCVSISSFVVFLFLFLNTSKIVSV